MEFGTGLYWSCFAGATLALIIVVTVGRIKENRNPTITTAAAAVRNLLHKRAGDKATSFLVALGDGAVEDLETPVWSTEPDSIGRAHRSIEVLGQIGTPRAVKALIRIILHHSSSDVHNAASEALVHIGGSAVDQLHPYLHNYDRAIYNSDAAAGQFLMVAGILRDIRDRRSVKEFIELMGASDYGFMDERCSWTGGGELYERHGMQSAAVSALIEFGSEIIPEIIEAAGSPNWYARYGTVRVLTAFEDARSLSKLESLCADTHFMVAAAAKEALDTIKKNNS